MSNDNSANEAVEGTVEEVKGKAKEIFGAVTGDEDKVQEGQAQQDKAESMKEAAKAEQEAEQARADAVDDEQRQKANQNS